MPKPDLYSDPIAAKALSTIKERDRLKAINAELVEALEAIVARMDKGFVPCGFAVTSRNWMPLGTWARPPA